jgi:hypothetical protein
MKDTSLRLLSFVVFLDKHGWLLEEKKLMHMHSGFWANLQNFLRLDFLDDTWV